MLKLVRVEGTVQDIVSAQIKDIKTDWCNRVLYSVQLMKNRFFYYRIERTPQEVFFGCKLKWTLQRLSYLNMFYKAHGPRNIWVSVHTIQQKATDRRLHKTWIRLYSTMVKVSEDTV